MRGECSWDEFADKLCERFGDRNKMDVVEEFNKLKQGGVQVYQAQFEELRFIMINLNPHIFEPYFVSSFVSGLSENLDLWSKCYTQKQ